MIEGAVYCVTLVNVPDNDPLKGTSYIGQVVRPGMTAAEAITIRWAREAADAARTTTQLGFLAALQLYGVEAFEWAVLETFKGPLDDVHIQTNAREKHHIAIRGGQLRDMCPPHPIQQTFNQTDGGQSFQYRAQDAYVAQCWRKFKSKLQEHVDEFGTARVHPKYVSPCGYNLGQHCNKVKSRRSFLAGRQLEAERVAWLDQLPGWHWDGLNNPEYRTELSVRMTKRLKHTNLAADSWNGATSEERDDRNKRRDATMGAARERKRAKMSKSEQEKHIQKSNVSKTYSAKRQRDMKALRATLLPDARWSDLSKYRKDGTVKKALRLFQASP